MNKTFDMVNEGTIKLFDGNDNLITQAVYKSPGIRLDIILKWEKAYHHAYLRSQCYFEVNPNYDTLLINSDGSNIRQSGRRKKISVPPKEYNMPVETPDQ